MQAAKGMEAGEEKSKYMIQRAQYFAGPANRTSTIS